MMTDVIGRIKMRKILVKIMYIVYALKKMNDFHVGDVVKIKESGKIGMLIQGVSNPYWDIDIIEFRVNKVHKDKFKLSNPIKGRLQRIKQSYNFQMRNWCLIDTGNKPLFKRISYRG